MEKDLKSRSIKGGLLQKILGVVFIVIISCSIGAILSGFFTNQCLTKSINKQIDDSFEQVFSKIDTIFVHFEDIATDNIRKTSGLFSLEQVWGIFLDGQKRYSHEAKSIIDKRLSQFGEGDKIAKEKFVSDVNVDLEALSSQINQDIEKHTRDYVRHSIEKIGSANVTLVTSQEWAQREIGDIHDKAIMSVKKSIEENQTFGLASLLFLMGMIALIVSLIAFGMARTITRPISMMAKSFNEMATMGGQLKPMQMSVSGEMKQLMDAFNYMIANLHKVTASRDELNMEIAIRKEAEEALRLSEERFSQVALHSGDWIWEVDEQGRYTYSSLVVEHVLGYKVEEILKKTVFDLLPSEDKDSNVQRIKTAFLTKTEVPLFIRKGLHKNGHVVILESTATPVLYQGSLIGFRGVTRDITQREFAQEELKAAYQELKSTQAQLVQSEKMASIGQLAAGVAHEINNPLGFISNNMEILGQYIDYYLEIQRMVESQKKSIEAGDLQKAQAIAQEIDKFEKEIDLDHVNTDLGNLMQHTQRGLERIQKIVLDLRTFAREGNDVVDFIKIEDVIDGVLSIAYNEFKYKAELKKDYGDTPPLRCSAQKLGQVFINLLVNASQAIKEKGEVEIKTYVQGEYVCVDIRDSGEGISPENVKKIFDPFFTTKPVGQGTGLGLSVSHEIIKKHGGEIKVQSKVGEGTTFTVMLPLSDNAGLTK